MGGGGVQNHQISYENDGVNKTCFKLLLIATKLLAEVGGGGDDAELKDLCNANACWLVLIYNTLIITNVAKRLFKYVPYILL